MLSKQHDELNGLLYQILCQLNLCLQLYTSLSVCHYIGICHYQWFDSIAIVDSIDNPNQTLTGNADLKS